MQHTGHAAQDGTHSALMRKEGKQMLRQTKQGTVTGKRVVQDRQILPMRSNRSMATVSKARRIMGYSSSTSLKWSTEREKSRQYVSARTLAVRLPLVSRQISVKNIERKTVTALGNTQRANRENIQVIMLYIIIQMGRNYKGFCIQRRNVKVNEI